MIYFWRYWTSRNLTKTEIQNNSLLVSEFCLCTRCQRIKNTEYRNFVTVKCHTDVKTCRESEYCAMTPCYNHEVHEITYTQPDRWRSCKRLFAGFSVLAFLRPEPVWMGVELARLQCNESSCLLDFFEANLKFLHDSVASPTWLAVARNSAFIS